MSEGQNGAEASTNHLASEKSPYLLQHADNPVDWHPWSEEAFNKAKLEDKPIFLSIGYATCHWCHVMAHESFEDEEVARVLNESFVSIKVDREERPDIDQIYMSVCQALTKSGGWPLTIIMTPDAKPFFAGTYFPKEGRMGMTGLLDILGQISGLWVNDRERIFGIGDEITRALRSSSERSSPPRTLDDNTLQKAYTYLSRSFDPKYGGFGSAPKFPSPHQLTFLIRRHARHNDPVAKKMVVETLDAMRNGGIFDQIGFGFHRYSVDERWLVPHFEKMLYDQALLLMAYVEAYQAFGENRFAQTAREICTYVLRDMTAPEGGFYSAEDADSEGKEGLYYVWKPEEIIELLGKEEGERFCNFYNVQPGGNFEEGFSIPHITLGTEIFAKRANMDPSELENLLDESRKRLFQVREKRIHPLKDDKIITSWNGMMIAALAKAYQALKEPAYLAAASNAADFIMDKLRAPDGALIRRYREGEAAHAGFADDYAFLVWGLIELYEASFQVRFLKQAVVLNDRMLELFWDDSGKGFFFTGKENERLIAQTKELYDGAVPSCNSLGVLNLMRLARMTGRVDLEQKADEAIKAFSSELAEAPMAHTQFMNALDFMIGPSREIVIAGDPDSEITVRMIEKIHARFLPNKILMLRGLGENLDQLVELSPFVEPLLPIGDRPTAYVCEQYACKTPVTDADSLENVL